jgi:dTDP-4-amino-4,6-dideoxygalactose transaminase
MHDQIAYKKYSNSDNLKISTDLCQEVLSLPMHPYLSEDQVIYITEKIKKFLD